MHKSALKAALFAAPGSAAITSTLWSSCADDRTAATVASGTAVTTDTDCHVTGTTSMRINCDKKTVTVFPAADVTCGSFQNADQDADACVALGTKFVKIVNPADGALFGDVQQHSTKDCSSTIDDDTKATIVSQGQPAKMGTTDNHFTLSNVKRALVAPTWAEMSVVDGTTDCYVYNHEETHVKITCVNNAAVLKKTDDATCVGNLNDYGVAPASDVLKVTCDQAGTAVTKVEVALTATDGCYQPLALTASHGFKLSCDDAGQFTVKNFGTADCAGVSTDTNAASGTADHVIGTVAEVTATVSCKIKTATVLYAPNNQATAVAADKVDQTIKTDGSCNTIGTANEVYADITCPAKSTSGAFGMGISAAVISFAGLLLA